MILKLKKKIREVLKSDFMVAMLQNKIIII